MNTFYKVGKTALLWKRLRDDVMYKISTQPSYILSIILINILYSCMLSSILIGEGYGLESFIHVETRQVVQKIQLMAASILLYRVNRVLIDYITRILLTIVASLTTHRTVLLQAYRDDKKLWFHPLTIQNEGMALAYIQHSGYFDVDEANIEMNQHNISAITYLHRHKDKVS